MRDDTEVRRPDGKRSEVAVEHGPPGVDRLTVATPGAADDDGEPTDFGDGFVPA